MREKVNQGFTNSQIKADKELIDQTLIVLNEKVTNLRQDIDKNFSPKQLENANFSQPLIQKTTAPNLFTSIFSLNSTPSPLGMQPTDEFDEYAIKEFKLTVERRKFLLEKIGKDPANTKFKRLYRTQKSNDAAANIDFLTKTDT